MAKRTTTTTTTKATTAKATKATKAALPTPPQAMAHLLQGSTKAKATALYLQQVQGVNKWLATATPAQVANCQAYWAALRSQAPTVYCSTFTLGAPPQQAQATLPGQVYGPTQPTAKSVVRDFSRQPSARTVAKLQAAAQVALQAAPKGAAEFKVLPAHCSAGGIAPGWVASTPKNRYLPGGFSSRAWQAAGYTVVRYTRGVCLVLTPNK